MAIFHLCIKTVNRAKGRSAVAASAYRAGVRMSDQRLSQTFDYRKKRGVVSSKIILPEHALTTFADRTTLWNAAEKSELRKNSTVTREFELALPTELKPEQRQELALAFAQELCQRHQFAIDIAIHEPGKGGDNRNHHAHILTTTRRLSNSRLGEKCRELDDQKSDEVLFWRERWAQLVNQALQAAKQLVRVDHRSLQDQGVDREPSTHDGPARTAIHRRLRRRAAEMAQPTTSPRQALLAQQLEAMRVRLGKQNISRYQISSSIGKKGGRSAFRKNDAQHGTSR